LQDNQNPKPKTENGALMSKSELIDTIRELNSTASVEFLSQFDEKDLKEYMSHLLETDRAELTAAAPSVPFN